MTRGASQPRSDYRVPIAGMGPLNGAPTAPTSPRCSTSGDALADPYRRIGAGVSAMIHWRPTPFPNDFRVLGHNR